MVDEVSREEAERVLRRAAELSAHDHRSGGLDRAALEAAAAEVGIERDAIAQAFAELDAGLLSDDEHPGVLGSSRVRVARVVDLDRDAATEAVRRWLRSQTLEPSERSPAAETWRPRSDLLAKVRRGVDLRGRVRLRTADAVHVAVASVGDSAALVRLEADFDAMRRGLLTGAVAIPGSVPPVLGVLLGLFTGDVVFALGGIPVGAVFGSLGLIGGRRTLASERAEARRLMELVLDELGS